MENQIFYVDELAVEPQAGHGVSIMCTGDPAVANRAFGEAFVEPGQGILGGGERVSLSLPDFISAILICCLGLGAKTSRIFR